MLSVYTARYCVFMIVLLRMIETSKILHMVQKLQLQVSCIVIQYKKF